MDWEPLVIAAAPNGARKSKADHPALPVTPEELAVTASDCLDAGASMIHLHVRDAQGRHSLDAELYRTAMSAIRRAVGDQLVIQVTSEAAGVYQPPAQIEQIKLLRPEAVSLSVRELIPLRSELSLAAEFFAWLAAEHVATQYILYSADDISFYRELSLAGVIPPVPHWLLFVLGRYDTGFTSSPVSLLPFLSTSHLQHIPWAICAFGRMEHVSAACAATLGGHVRLGFENNLYLKDGRIAASNAQLIAQMVDVAAAIGRPVANVDDLRQMFHND